MSIKDDNQNDIIAKMEEYSTFVSEKLKPELDLAEKSRRETRTEIDGYEDLSQKLKDFQGQDIAELKTVVDLGHEALFCEAVGDLSMIYVHVGMGFHVQMTIPEAIVFSQKRVKFLEKHVLKKKDLKIREITEHIMAASAILDELHREMNG